MAAAGEALLQALQGQALVREALASAAVALYAAAGLPAVDPAALACCLAEGLFLDGASQGATVVRLPREGVSINATTAPAPVGLLDAHLQQRHGGGQGLAPQLRRLPPLNRICAMRGLLAALPGEVTCAPLALAGAAEVPEQQAGGAPRPWLLLVDGALPAIAAAIQVRRVWCACRGAGTAQVFFCETWLARSQHACRAAYEGALSACHLTHLY